MFLKHILIVLLIGSFFLISCSDTPTNIGSRLLQIDAPVLKVATTDSMTQTSAIVKHTINTNTSTSLLVGKSLNVEASFLMRFLILLTDTLVTDILSNNINVLDATVELYQTYSFGEGNLDYTVHNATYYWQAATFTSDSLSRLTYDPADISDSRTFSDSLNTFKINTDVVKSWLLAEADTTMPSPSGIYVKPDPGSQKIIGFQALTTDNDFIPVIKIIIEKPGIYVDTLNYISLSDLHLVTGEIPSISEGGIAAQSGVAFSSKLFFDLSLLPANISINNAELRLTLDTLETVTGSVFENSLRALYLVDTTRLDTSGAQITLIVDRANGTITGDLTTYVRAWYETKQNNGILLQTFDPATGVELFVINGSNSPAGLKPELRIIYNEAF